jgi:hypothetical protein
MSTASASIPASTAATVSAAASVGDELLAAWASLASCTSMPATSAGDVVGLVTTTSDTCAAVNAGLSEARRWQPSDEVKAFVR